MGNNEVKEINLFSRYRRNLQHHPSETQTHHKNKIQFFKNGNITKQTHFMLCYIRTLTIVLGLVNK